MANTNVSELDLCHAMIDAEARCFAKATTAIVVNAANRADWPNAKPFWVKVPVCKRCFELCLKARKG